MRSPRERAGNLWEGKAADAVLSPCPQEPVPRTASLCISVGWSVYHLKDALEAPEELRACGNGVSLTVMELIVPPTRPRPRPRTHLHAHHTLTALTA